jgi:hypothetical protein
MSKDADHGGYRDADTAEYEQQVHPSPYTIMPHDLWTGLALAFFVGFMLGMVCLGILTPFATSLSRPVEAEVNHPHQDQ